MMTGNRGPSVCARTSIPGAGRARRGEEWTWPLCEPIGGSVLAQTAQCATHSVEIQRYSPHAWASLDSQAGCRAAVRAPWIFGRRQPGAREVAATFGDDGRYLPMLAPAIATNPLYCSDRAELKCKLRQFGWIHRTVNPIVPHYLGRKTIPYETRGALGSGYTKLTSFILSYCNFRTLQ